MFLNSIAIFLSALALHAHAQTTVIQCKTLPTVNISFETLGAYSPWDVQLSSDPSYNCVTAMLTGPAPADGTTYTWVMTQNQTIKNSASLKYFSPNYSVSFTTCAKDAVYDYKFLVFNQNFFITYICEPSGNAVSVLRGYGHTPDDLNNMTSILQGYNLNFTGSATVTNMLTGCQPSPYCNGFYM